MRRRSLSFVLAAAAVLAFFLIPAPSTPAPSEDLLVAAPAPPEESGRQAVYEIPPDGLDLEETVEVYLEQQYRAYLAMDTIDLSAILDFQDNYMQNAITWTALLNQRRRLLTQHGLSYVETEAFPYRVVHIDEPALEDERVSVWTEFGLLDDGEVLVHFTVEGEPGRAYPPLLAVNSQHSMVLRQEDGVWKIVLHYFPGALRKYLWRQALELPTEDAMLTELRREFAPREQPAQTARPHGTIPYDSDAAARYALEYTESRSSAFYFIGDWMGNCANFTSQCIWSGFGKRMTPGWYAGEGGGSPAWENVSYFWEHIMEGSELGGRELDGVAALREGDLIQTASGVLSLDKEEDRFNHSLVVVDADRLVLAQHSPACFVYYADLADTDTRFVRPHYLVE